MATTIRRQAEVDGPDATSRASRPGRISLAHVAVVALVGLTVRPVTLAGVALVGDTWLPMSDWASMVHRTSWRPRPPAPQPATSIRPTAPSPSSSTAYGSTSTRRSTTT